MRTLRDYVESGGTVFHTIFNYTLGNYSNSSVTLVRNWINGTTVQYLTFSSASNALFNVTPSSNTTLPPNITISRQNTSSNSTITFLSTFNFTTTTPSTPTVPLIGLGASQLFLSTPPANASSSLNSTLTAIQNATTSSQIAFLAYTDKFLAGGWRFLTYFGRDTLLALRLLLPVISPTSAEAILGAVLERTNTTGALCHEETIGDYASFVNINNNQSNLGNTPSYSYVMLDTDFLLLPVMAEYYANNASGAQAFLNKTSSLMNGTYSQLLLKNVDHVLNLSMAFGENATKGNLVPIRDPTVGDWRDSNTGLGYGIYPFDVNSEFSVSLLDAPCLLPGKMQHRADAAAALIPAALRAIAVLANASIIPSNYSSNATRYAQVWETQSSQYFEVSISPSAATSSLNTYVTAANLSSALLYGAGSLNTSSNSSYGWGATNQVIGDDAGSLGNSTFYGLSIDRNGSVVEVLNSDLGFVMLYGNNVSARVVQAVVDAMQPYPRGELSLSSPSPACIGRIASVPRPHVLSPTSTSTLCTTPHLAMLACRRHDPAHRRSPHQCRYGGSQPRLLDQRLPHPPLLQPHVSRRRLLVIPTRPHGIWHLPPTRPLQYHHVQHSTHTRHGTHTDMVREYRTRVGTWTGAVTAVGFDRWERECFVY